MRVQDQPFVSAAKVAQLHRAEIHRHPRRGWQSCGGARCCRRQAFDLPQRRVLV